MNTTMPPNTALTVRLRDGRTLGYAEYGDAAGKPVFFFHGFPGVPHGADLIPHGLEIAGQVQ